MWEDETLWDDKLNPVIEAKGRTFRTIRDENFEIAKLDDNPAW